MASEGTTSCIEELRDAVLCSPSILGRLIAVAGLRDRETGQYRHELAARFGTGEVDWALRELHRQIFLGWLNFSLRQQTADLNLYLPSADADEAVLAKLYASAETWIPPACAAVERELFLSDLCVVTGIIRAGL